MELLDQAQAWLLRSQFLETFPPMLRQALGVVSVGLCRIQNEPLAFGIKVDVRGRYEDGVREGILDHVSANLRENVVVELAAQPELSTAR